MLRTRASWREELLVEIDWGWRMEEYELGSMISFEAFGGYSVVAFYGKRRGGFPRI